MSKKIKQNSLFHKKNIRLLWTGNFIKNAGVRMNRHIILRRNYYYFYLFQIF